MFAVGVLAVAIGLVLTLSPTSPRTTASRTTGRSGRGEAGRPVLAAVFLTAAAAFAVLTAITPDRSIATSTHRPATRSTPVPSSPAAPSPAPGRAG